jgi:hypothetical protein
MPKEIQEFWSIDQSMLSKDKIKEKIQEYYGDDFINNYTKWKNNIKEIDTYIIQYLRQNNYDITTYKLMEFDYFCKKTINYMCQSVDINNILVPTDVLVILEKIGVEFLNEYLETYDIKKYTISNLLKSIQKIKVSHK